MPLVFDLLKTGLEKQWLVPEGGGFPQSVAESGDRFAGAVSSWFAAAQAGTLPCATAIPRKSQLATTAAAALGAMSAQAAGAQLALAVATYIAGQAFGAGVAGFPIATSAAISQMIAVFSDTGGSVGQKAEQIATACTLLATTTIVAGPIPLFPSPIV